MGVCHFDARSSSVPRYCCGRCRATGVGVTVLEWGCRLSHDCCFGACKIRTKGFWKGGYPPTHSFPRRLLVVVGADSSLEEDVFVGMTILRAASKMPFSGSTGVGRAAFRASSAQKGSKEDDLIPEKKNSRSTATQKRFCWRTILRGSPESLI